MSSRANRAQDAPKAREQRAEDFMDEEDLADAADAQRLQTSASFAGLGRTEDDAGRRGALVDILKTEGETMGVKLLRRMGWRDGQGLGPRLRRRARLEDDDREEESRDDREDGHWFAPANPPCTTLVTKNDSKGLGYQAEARMDSTFTFHGRGGNRVDGGEEDDRVGGPLLPSEKPEASNRSVRGGFGVGILNDTGSDDEDPYAIGPRISYHRVLGGTKKANRKGTRSSSDTGRTSLGASARLAGSKHVFVSKKLASSSKAGFQKCHDGRLPLEGFLLSARSEPLPPTLAHRDRRYPPPEIPKDWRSSKKPAPSHDAAPYQSTAEAARASTLNPRSRATLLGEAPLPGKSVFDFLSPAARDRIASASGRTTLPPGRGEAGPTGDALSDETRRGQGLDLMPHLDRDVAFKALGRGVGSWMPYAEDESKRARYRAFLEIEAGLRAGGPERSPGTSADDWLKELHEFAHAAQIFKPMTGMMASRFTSARSQVESQATGKSDTASVFSTEDLLRRAESKAEDPAEAAAKVGMFGPLTRSTQTFYPTRLLCKRFNVRPPLHVGPDPEASSTATGHGGDQMTTTSTALPTKSLELVSPTTVMDLLRDSGTVGGPRSFPAPVKPEVVIDTERNQALEAERPGEAVFKAIFGSDSENED